MNVLDLLRAEGVSQRNAEVTVKIFQKLDTINRRDEVIEKLSTILRKNGKAVDSEMVKALADTFMSRKKWSAKRLRDLYEGFRVGLEELDARQMEERDYWDDKGYLRYLAALHGISRGYGVPGDSVLDIFKNMAEAGAERRSGQFTGIVGEVEQKVHLEWWRSQ